MLKLLVIGVILFLVFRPKANKAKPAPKEKDEDFDDMFLNGASGEDIDDFEK